LLSDLSNLRFSALHDLRILDFSWNQLTSVAEEICELPLLEVLNLSHNQIVSRLRPSLSLLLNDFQRSLPSSFYELRALQSVNLSHNSLHTVGEHFERMISLHTLDLSGNEKINIDDLPTRTRRLHEKVRILPPLSLRLKDD
jgi:hypothetical protein